MVDTSLYAVDRETVAGCASFYGAGRNAGVALYFDTAPASYCQARFAVSMTYRLSPMR